MGERIPVCQKSAYANRNQVQLHGQAEKLHWECYHNEQMWRALNCGRKLRDFIDSIADVAPDYQQIAFQECCAVLESSVKE